MAPIIRLWWGGDFQLPPAELANAGFGDRVGATLIASGAARGTCRATTYHSELDYFYVQNALALGVKAVNTIETAGTRPHVPVALTFHPRITSARALFLRLPPPLPLERVYGPVPADPDWTGIRAKTMQLAEDARHCDIDTGFRRRYQEVFSDWADQAEAELVQVTGHQKPIKLGLRGKEPKLVWRSIVPEKVTDPGDDVVIAWRIVAGVATDLQRIAAYNIIDDGDGPERAGGAEADAHDSDDVTDHDAGGEIYLRQLIECRAALDQVTRQDEDLTSIIGRFREAIDDVSASVQSAIDHSSDRGRRTNGRLPQGEELDGDRRNLLSRAIELRLEVTREMDKAASTARAEAHRQWREWLVHNIDAGARNAHKYLRIPEIWRPTTTLVTDGVVTADPLKLLDGYRTKYKGLWQGSDADQRQAHGNEHGEEVRRNNWTRPWRNLDRQRMERLTPAAIRQASSSFRAGTMSTYDGFAMRQYALLSDSALEALADIFDVLELTSDLPPQAQLSTMPLIGKTRGGHRTVGSLSSPYRLWSRARKHHVTAWEARNDRPYIAAGTARAPQDAVWRQAARAEASAQRGLCAATLLWDMASYYERVRRLPLWHRARRLDFPSVILRVALSLYDCPRMLSLSGALSRPLLAIHGIIAGCSFANALTRAYSMDPYDRVAAAIDDLPTEHGALDVFVDDVALTVTGTKAQVMTALVDAKDILQREITDSLYCHVEMSKAAVVSSDAGLTRALAKKFGDLAGPVSARNGRRAATNLGVDYAAGRSRAALAQSGRRKKRMRTLQLRSRRLARVRSLLGRRAPNIFASGLLAEAEYGAAVNGFTDVEIVKLRRAAAQALTPRARGRSLTRVMLLAKVPTWRAEVAPALQYARQVWEAAIRKTDQLNGGMTLADISRVWHGAQRDDLLHQGRRKWTATRGPISTLMLTLHRVRWSMPTPFVMRDHNGEDIPLTKVSPAMLAQLLKNAVVAEVECREGARIAARDPNFIGRRVGVDHVISQLQGDKKLTAADKAAYKSVVCGALMTFSRAYAEGYLVEDRCPLCGQLGDTVRHRIWKCCHPDAVRARNATAPQWLQQEQERREACDSFWITGWLPHPADTWPAPAASPDAQIIYGEAADGEEPSDDEVRNGICGTIYGDGSCTTHVYPELRRAATSIVQRQPGGNVVKRILCPVATPLPQTPQSAEYMVVALVQQLAQKGRHVDLAVDCLNVVRDSNLPFRTAVSAKRVHAGIMRSARLDDNWNRHITVRKVKAHANPEQAANERDRQDAIGNDWADKNAKAALLLHPRPSPVDEAMLEAAIKRARLVVRTIAAVTQVFPPLPKERLARPPRAAEGSSFAAAGGHKWRYACGLWRCSECLKLTLDQQLSPQLANQRCPGPKPSTQLESITAHGHVVARTVASLPIIFCLRCGAFTARRAYGLAAPCKGRPTGPGAQALARIRRGQQPWQRPATARARTHNLFEAWSRDRSDFVRQSSFAARGQRHRNTVEAAVSAQEPTGGQGGGTERAAAAAFPQPPTPPAQPADHQERPRDSCEAGANDHGEIRFLHGAAEAPLPEPVSPEGAHVSHAGRRNDHDSEAIDDDEDPFGHGGDLDQAEDRRRMTCQPPQRLQQASRSPQDAANPIQEPRRGVQRARTTVGGGLDMLPTPRRGGLGRAADTSAGSAGASGASSTWNGGDQHTPVWLSPPSWLYLPHLFPPVAVGPSVAPRDGNGTGVDDVEVDQSGTGAPIGGHVKRRRRWYEDINAHETQQYILDAAFDDHRNRVERKRAAMGTQCDQAPTAAQRIEALRRRIAERSTHVRDEMADRRDAESAYGCNASVKARAANKSGTGACVGPGDPSAADATAAAVDPSRDRAAAAVVQADVATTPHPPGDYARPADAGRGEVAYGPPGGAAAPPDDTGLMVAGSPGSDSTTPLTNPWSSGGEGPQNGQLCNSPQNTPRQKDLERSQALGSTARPSTGDPPTEELARRRDGAGAPSVGYSAARGSGAAAEADGGMQPQRGCSRHHQYGARVHECHPCIAADDAGAHSRGGDADSRHDGRLSPARAPQRAERTELELTPAVQPQALRGQEPSSGGPPQGDQPPSQHGAEDTSGPRPTEPTPSIMASPRGLDGQDTERPPRSHRNRFPECGPADRLQAPRGVRPCGTTGALLRPAGPAQPRGPLPGARPLAEARGERVRADAPRHSRAPTGARQQRHGPGYPRSPEEEPCGYDLCHPTGSMSSNSPPRRDSPPNGSLGPSSSSGGDLGADCASVRLAEHVHRQLRSQHARRLLCRSLGSGGGARGPERAAAADPGAGIPPLEGKRAALLRLAEPHVVHPSQTGEIRGRGRSPGAQRGIVHGGDRRRLIEMLRRPAVAGAEGTESSAEAARPRAEAGAGTYKRQRPSDMRGTDGAATGQLTSDDTRPARPAASPSRPHGAGGGGEQEAVQHHGIGRPAYGQPLGRPPGDGGGVGLSNGAASGSDGLSPVIAPAVKRPRRAGPHWDDVITAELPIRGQGYLPGTRGAGNQCEEAQSGHSSNEDAKMHQAAARAGRIQFTACHGRGSAGEDSVDAADVAARHVAWHTSSASD